MGRNVMKVMNEINRIKCYWLGKCLAAVYLKRQLNHEDVYSWKVIGPRDGLVAQ